MSILPTLLNPSLIWLLPLATIPVLLHLLTLQRLRTVELSTYRFLFDSYVQQRRRMQFLQALLAILRTLFILFLVMAVSRPVLQSWGGLFEAGSGREVILLMDCSASMNSQSLGQSALDRAKEAAKLVVGRLHPDDRVTLIRVAGKPEEIFSRYQTDLNSIEESISNLTASPSRANLYAALISLFGPDAKAPKSPLIYFFTDAQASSWKELKKQKDAASKFLPEGTPFIVVQVGSAVTGANIAVTGQPPPRQRAIIGLPIALQARVVNYAITETEATLRLFINDKEIPAQRATFKLQAGEERIHKFAPFEPSDPGILRGRFEVALTGKGTDAFPEDDRYLFTLAVQPKVRVLVVNGNPSADFFENESLYLKAALTAERTPQVGDAKDAKPAIKGVTELARSLELVEVAEGALTPEAIRDAGVIVLANCGALNPDQFARLRDFAGDGGGLLIFPGERVNPEIYNKQFFSIPNVAELLSEATLGVPVGDPTNSSTFVKFARIATDHPIFSVFEPGGAAEVRYFDRVYLKRRFPITLDKPQRTSVLIEAADRTPALVQSRFGEGVVMVASFPLNTRWTNLPLNGAEFVPMMLRMVTYAQARPEAEGPLVVGPDGLAEFSVSGKWAPITGRVIDAAQRPFPLVFERAGIRQTAVFDQTSERGFYTAEIRSDRDAGKSADLTFAVNLTPDESDLRPLSEDDAKELLPGAEVRFVDASAEAGQEKGSLGNEQEIWRPLIWVMFAIICFEFLLSTLKGSKAPAEESASVSERIAGYSPNRWVGRMTGGGGTAAAS